MFKLVSKKEISDIFSSTKLNKDNHKTTAYTCSDCDCACSCECDCDCNCTSDCACGYTCEY